MSVAVDNVKLTPELEKFIEEWRVKPGNLIMVLHKTQSEYGYIPRDVAFKIGKLLDVPLAKIYGVISFYHFFKTVKPGKNIISVCMGTACYLKGGQDLIEELENVLGIGVGGTTDDELFTLQAVRCIGCCGLAPVLTIGEDVYGKLTTDKIPEIVGKYMES